MNRRPRALSLILAAALTTVLDVWAQKAPVVPQFDIVIANGHIVDGTGSPWYSGDVGIRDGRIAAIGGLAGKPAMSFRFEAR